MVDLRAPGLDAVAREASSHLEDVRKTMQRATRLVQRGDVSGALQAVDTGLSRRKNDYALLEAKGLLLLMLDRPQEALECLDRAGASGADGAELHTGRAIALYQLDRLKESVAAFNESLGLKQDENVSSMKQGVLDELLWSLVHQGFASWSGGKPQGSDPPIEVSPGPPISDLIHEMRR
jgi:tetratricopeptide (TPR) repeat protein